MHYFLSNSCKPKNAFFIKQPTLRAISTQINTARFRLTMFTSKSLYIVPNRCSFSMPRKIFLQIILIDYLLITIKLVPKRIIFLLQFRCMQPPLDGF